MKVVIDNNIFVSAYLRGGNPYKVLSRSVCGLDMLFITADILSEIEGTFGKPKFSLTKKQVDDFIVDIKAYAHKVTVLPRHKATGVCQHPKDDKYLECAHAAGADYIITGDSHLLDLKNHHGTKIITAREYLDIFNVSASLSQ